MKKRKIPQLGVLVYVYTKMFKIGLTAARFVILKLSVYK